MVKVTLNYTPETGTCVISNSLPVGTPGPHKELHLAVLIAALTENYTTAEVGEMFDRIQGQGGEDNA